MTGWIVTDEYGLQGLEMVMVWKMLRMAGIMGMMGMLMVCLFTYVPASSCPAVQSAGAIYNGEGAVIDFETEETISFFNNRFGIDVSSSAGMGRDRFMCSGMFVGADGIVPNLAVVTVPPLNALVQRSSVRPWKHGG